VAQAAATSALLTGNRFTLGVGTGEALNEHILGGQVGGEIEGFFEFYARHVLPRLREAG
jgi:hypothetical protein